MLVGEVGCHALRGGAGGEGTRHSRNVGRSAAACIHAHIHTHMYIYIYIHTYITYARRVLWGVVSAVVGVGVAGVGVAGVGVAGVGGSPSRVPECGGTSAMRHYGSARSAKPGTRHSLEARLRYATHLKQAEVCETRHSLEARLRYATHLKP
jgi:hypothetical protein